MLGEARASEQVFWKELPPVVDPAGSSLNEQFHVSKGPFLPWDLSTAIRELVYLEKCSYVRVEEKVQNLAVCTNGKNQV